MRARPATVRLGLGVALLCLLLTMGALSHVGQMAVGYDAARTTVLVVAVDGEASVMWDRSPVPRPRRGGWMTAGNLPRASRWDEFVRRPGPYRGRAIALLGAGCVNAGHVGVGGLTTSRAAWVPFWLPCAVVAVPIGISCFRRARLRHRRLAGRCATCGYDLRASGSHCPECGNVNAAAVASGLR